VAQAVEHLLCKREAVSSNPSPAKKKKKLASSHLIENKFNPIKGKFVTCFFKIAEKLKRMKNRSGGVLDLPM
jgi:hypothetical protein